MNNNEFDKRQQQALNDAQTERFADEVGHKAVVQRTDIENPRTEQLREVLADIGRDFLETNMVPKGMTYVGSAAVHIYSAGTIGVVAYLEQLNLNECPEALAGPAFTSLRGAGLKFYGHKRQTKRSGF